ncbi:hypothetical protein CC80DRAFT_566592 [Byssothecium circinans]|uniref:Uncharacterized protein n=1 Tax=Byssothecium circinans TaxID=147558 RepID=A0A6A5TRT9_9PLEO|nr:hypothetical protein CC80DRAFT_566592 [Byssothecium circinans]
MPSPTSASLTKMNLAYRVAILLPESEIRRLAIGSAGDRGATGQSLQLCSIPSLSSHLYSGLVTTCLSSQLRSDRQYFMALELFIPASTTCPIVFILCFLRSN